MSAFIVIGELSIKPADEQRWRGASIDTSGFDWLEGAPVLTGVYEGGPKTVAEALDPAALRAGNGASFVEVTAADGKLRAAAWLEGDLAEPYLTGLVTALRSAGKHGGKGHVYVFPFGEQIAIRVGCGKKSSIEIDAPNEAFEKHGLAFIEVVQWTHHKAKHPARTRDEYRELASRYFLAPIVDAPPAHRALMTALVARSPAELVAAADRCAVVGPGDVPIAGEIGKAKAVADALARDDAYLRVVGVYLLAQIDPKAAEPIALALATDESTPLRRMAFAALGSAVSNAAVEALLAHDEDETVRGTQIEALGRIAHPELDARILAAIRGSADLKSDVYAPIASGAATPEQVAECEAAFARGRHLVDAATARKITDAVPALLVAVQAAIPPNLRQHICQSLLAIGGKEVEKVQGKLQHAMFGMGLALNQDDTRRRELLQIGKKKDLGGIIKFDDLDLPRFRALADERFIDLASQQNEAPPAGAFLEMLERFPEMRCNGYAVSKDRDDYRVMIEGASCSLDEIPEDRRAAARETFVALCSEATQFEDEGDELSAWWT